MCKATVDGKFKLLEQYIKLNPTGIPTAQADFSALCVSKATLLPTKQTWNGGSDGSAGLFLWVCFSSFVLHGLH